MRKKRKPDLLAVLVVVVGLGVIATAFAQGMLSTGNTETHLASYQTTLPAAALSAPTQHSPALSPARHPALHPRMP